MDTINIPNNEDDFSCTVYLHIVQYSNNMLAVSFEDFRLTEFSEWNFGAKEWIQNFYKEIGWNVALNTEVRMYG
jgi:hypothetical protein